MSNGQVMCSYPAQILQITTILLEFESAIHSSEALRLGVRLCAPAAPCWRNVKTYSSTRDSLDNRAIGNIRHVGTWNCRERFRSFLFSSTLSLREVQKQSQSSA